MINIEALFTLSYGLYIVSSGNKNKASSFISNTVFQVTAEPPQFAACCNKDNYTAELIKETGSFSVSVLHKDCKADIIGRFGYKSGRTFNKMEGLDLKHNDADLPIVLNDTIAYFICKLTSTIDVGSHYIFIATLVEAVTIDDEREPLTYAHYRNVRKGVAPKNAPTYIDKSKLETKKAGEDFKKYKCTACGFVYDEALGYPQDGIKPGTRFEDLPVDWKCIACGCDKDDFVEIT